ncbi:MAG: Nif3-like dinuclear metal center hexameric protein [Deltaproteobacteria bacterium]|nr:Nif3-like dinuclear metal center hexameric protein [Deltaproteobacteria bacterium]
MVVCRNHLTHGALIDFLETRIPSARAENWDNSGLQAGSRKWPLQGVLCALDFSLELIAEAEELGANFIFTHHPLFFKPFSRIDFDVFPGCLLDRALAAGMTLFSAHTNLDSIGGGVNDALGDLLGIEDRQPLREYRHEVYKLVTFVPAPEAEKLADLLFAAGAGNMGNGLYSDCAFRSRGVGSFRPASGANPRSGKVGELNLVDEVRLETVIDKPLLPAVLSALFRGHPYEVPAYDLYPMALPGRNDGLGRIGCLRTEITLADFVQVVKHKLRAPVVRLVGEKFSGARVKRIALCGGSGFSLYGAARSAGADLYVTGDLKYHEAREVLDHGTPPILDAGHFATERPVLEIISRWCLDFARSAGARIPVFISSREREPWSYM